MTRTKKVDPTDTHFLTRDGEPKRDQYGRYMLPDPRTGEVKSWTRVTTVSDLLSDRYNLEMWAQRMVALGLAKRADLLALVKTSRGDKRTLNRVVKDALEAGNGEQRANIGTAIHAATELMDRGERWDIGAPYDADVERYGEVMDEGGYDVCVDEQGDLWVERIVLNVALGVAGTLDRLMIRPSWKKPRVCDVKTGKTVSFSELDHAIQQAMYAHAEYYWSPTAKAMLPMPADVDKDHAVIIHLPAGEARCELHELDIARGIEAARVAVDVKRWRGVKDLSKPIEN